VDQLTEQSSGGASSVIGWSCGGDDGAEFCWSHLLLAGAVVEMTEQGSTGVI
jgi:hypothetical protein